MQQAIEPLGNGAQEAAPRSNAELAARMQAIMDEVHNSAAQIPDRTMPKEQILTVPIPIPSASKPVKTAVSSPPLRDPITFHQAVPYSGPPAEIERDPWIDWGFPVAAVLGLIVLLAVSNLPAAARISAINKGVLMLKKRAALVACLGAGLAAAGLVLDPNEFGYETAMRDAMSHGYVALFGAGVFLLGIYYWMTAPE